MDVNMSCLLHRTPDGATELRRKLSLGAGLFSEYSYLSRIHHNLGILIDLYSIQHSTFIIGDFHNTSPTVLFTKTPTPFPWT